MQVLTRGLGRGQKLSASGRDSHQAEGRVSLKDDLIVRPSKWNAMEKGIQYLRASTVLEVICRDSKQNSKSSPLESQVRSSVHSPCGGSLCRARHHHMSALSRGCQ